MKVTIQTNTGIQNYPVESLTFDDAAYDVLHMGYNLMLSSGNMSSHIIFVASECLTRALADYQAQQGAIMSVAPEVGALAVSELTKVIALLSRHPAALATFEQGQPLGETP